ncbi:hypothetical protein RUND412_010717, partial [Rhizina undulata]
MSGSAINKSVVNNKNNHVYDSGNTITNSFNPTFNIGNTTGNVTVINEAQGRKRGDKRFKILAWLSKVNYKEHHKFIASVRQANTRDWLFEKKDFIDSTVIDMFMNRMPENHGLTYFYSKYGETERQEPDSILSTLAKQLSLLSPEGFLPKAVISLYQEQKNDGVERRLWLDESTELILQLSKAFEQTIIIVDALDECKKETRGKLLDALKELRSSTEGLKIFITSRNDDDIRVELENESDVDIQPSDNSSDIKRFVVAEVDKYILKKKLLRGTVRPELKQTIMDTLTNRADGMFFWVRLRIEHICLEKSERAIREALRRLPKDLEATYLVIWEKILSGTKDNCLMAQRTLSWIICAKRPLTVEEILDAVSITPMQWAEKPDHDGVTHMTLLDVCQNLVVLDTELRVFRTAHFSVTEFLLEKVGIREAHTAAAEVCLTLLCCENHAHTSPQTENYILYNYALHNYVMENWTEHIRLSGDGSSTLAELQMMFFKLSPAYSKWLVEVSRYDLALKSKYSKIQLNQVWVAYYLRLWDIFKYLLHSNSDSTMRNIFDYTPIHLIARHRYREGIKLLLEQKVVDLNAKDNSGQKPLYIAVDGGQETMVKLLLEQEGVDLNSKDDYGQTPLHAAVYGVQETIVRMLLEQEGVDLKAKNESGQIPLYAAAYRGHEAIFKLLFEQQGVDLNAKYKYGRTLLNAAVYQGHEAIFKLLLEQEGVDLNAKDTAGQTPLYVA